MPDEAPERVLRIGLAGELAITKTRVLLTRSEGKKNGVLSVPLRNITAVEVSDEKMSFLSAYVRFRVGGDWIEIEIGRDYKTCLEVYALLVERMG